MNQSVTQDDFASLFAPEPDVDEGHRGVAVWKVLLVDDDADMHAFLRLALSDLVVEDLPLQLLSAYTAEQARLLLVDHPDVALMLLDVVMETPQAGLMLARFIRQELNNRLMQIVLITGQPGYAPQREVVTEYEINGYRLKSELTAEKIFVFVYAAIRNHKTMLHLVYQQEKLDEAERRSRQDRMLKAFIVESSEDAIIGMTLGGVVTSWNRSAEKIFAYSAQEMIGHTLHAIIPADRREEDCKAMDTIIQGEIINLFETIRVKKDGSRIDVFMTMSPIRDADGQTVGISEIMRNITERKQAETKLRLAANVFTHARESIIITATDGTIIDVNDTFSRITGYSRSEVLGKNPRILSSGRQSKNFYSAMWHDLLVKGHWYGELWNRHKDGELYAVAMNISTVHDSKGAAMHYVALCTDVTLIKEHQKQLEHIAHFDVLTSLPNRVLLADRLQQGMNAARRTKRQLGVAFLDLDGFKVVNDQYGHDAGDQLLMILASRMEHVLREGDTLSRIGGDEFVAILTDLTGVDDSLPMLTRLLDAAAQPVVVDGQSLQVSASIGLTLYPQKQDVDADQLMRQADQAMYQAKLSGKNRYHTFDAELDSNTRIQHESEDRIRHALLEGEFVLYYQPKVNMQSGEIVGAEALIRWQHPEQGLLSPVLFLPVIEGHQIAVEIGVWVIDTALHQMEQWQAAGLDIPVSVNVGARQLQATDFVVRLRDLLSAHPNVKPGSLELEVLETSALEDIALVSETIIACREIGVNFALDDFGTGYSSLTYLKRLPVTLLKIDQSFVSDMLDDPDDLSILQGVLDLAIAFRRNVIAEGVETVEHGELLLQLGCKLAQGYGVAPPMPGDEFPGWAVSWLPYPSWSGQVQLNRNELPLLYASVEHRAWISDVAAYLQGTRTAPLPEEHTHCDFGLWLNSDGVKQMGQQPVFQLVCLLHQQLHELAKTQMALYASGQRPEALDQLDELFGLQDALFNQLKVLIKLMQGCRV